MLGCFKMISLMIADDNVSVAEHLSYMLTKEKDFRIINISHNGLEALMCYNSERPDVLLLNLDMPGINGLDVIENIEDEKKNIIAISGSYEYRSKLRDMTKIQWVLDKPFYYDELFEVIRKIKRLEDEKI